jgi:hypothetical protein
MNKKNCEEGDLQQLADLLTKLQLRGVFRQFGAHMQPKEKQEEAGQGSCTSSQELPDHERTLPLGSSTKIGYERTTINSILERIIVQRTGTPTLSRNRAGRLERRRKRAFEAS